tara:strand:- start:425 stop:1132 length:708 start_codon:yes stop_codon:yes gene_type:complete
VNNTKIDISKLHSDYDSYVLTNNDKNRIKPLKDIIRNNDINFKFFITISPYKFIPDTHSGRSFISESNKFLRTKIRKFYKSDIKFLFFTEKHSEASSKHSGGLHRHILIEDAPLYRWQSPSNSMMNFLEKFAPEAIFTARFGGEVSDLHKIELLKRVCRLCDQTPNGELGLDIRSIHNEEKLLGYCTKQIKSLDDTSGVIDIANSDYLNNPNRKTNEAFIKFPFHRPNQVFAGVN